MALVRVRGCAGLVPPGAEGSIQQADASRRQNGPRKATSRRPITVRLRGKSCLAGGHKASPDNERRAVVAMEGREPLSRRMWGRRPGRPGECPLVLLVLGLVVKRLDPEHNRRTRRFAHW